MKAKEDLSYQFEVDYSEIVLNREQLRRLRDSITSVLNGGVIGEQVSFKGEKGHVLSLEVVGPEAAKHEPEE